MGTKKVGGVLLALGTVQFFVMHLIVQNAWTEPRYSWWENYISDLGAVHCASVLGSFVCSPLHAAMNVAFVLQGVLLVAGVIALGGSRLWRIMIAVTGVSWIIVGLVPEDVNLTVHSIGAFPIFTLGNIALIVIGASASTRDRPVIRTAALVLGIVGLLGFVLIAVASANPDGPLGIGAAERIAVFPLQIWALLAGIAIAIRPSP